MRRFGWLLLGSVGVVGVVSGCAPSGTDSVFASGGSDATGTGSATTSTSDAGSTTGSGAECMLDDGCDAGSVCVGGQCVPGCNDGHPCAAPSSCCAGSCFDLTTDIEHCGSCDNACPTPQNAPVTCDMGCQVGQCDAGFFDCDGNNANGCESSTECACNPGEQQACYTGPLGTQSVGLCKDGARTCNASGNGYGPCTGQVLPDVEVCGDGLDHDCNGTANDVPDKDGDGISACNGDCCDEPGPCGMDPKLVNPGAFEFLNDGIDNDCDPGTSDTVGASCSGAQKFTGVTAIDMANAMDLCQMASGGKWGVVSASQIYVDGTAPNGADLVRMQNEQDAIMTGFGTGGIVPKKNGTMAVISSGKSRDDTDPGWVLPISGTQFTSSISFAGAGGPLGTYLGAHGGDLLPGHCGATTCLTGVGANDSTNLRLQIKTPTNAKSFSYDFRFFSAEYQTYQCTQFNDYYLAMLTSGAAGIPADHNISFDALNNPVSVNNGFFQVCGGNGKNCGTCPSGTGPLAGTGFDDVNGGGTDWLTTDAPVIGGETITLDLAVFDVNDKIYDTLILLDNFRWSSLPATVNTHE